MSRIFAVPGGPKAKWIVLAVWVVGILVASAANLPGKFTDAEENESTSFLPGDAESTKVLKRTEDLQGGELAPAVIVFRRDSGLTAADRRTINQDARRLTEKRFPGVIADGPTAASGGREGSSSQSEAPQQRPKGAAGAPGCAGPTTAVPGQPADYRPFVGPICSPDGKAAIVTAYLKGNGDSETILDPLDDWRDKVSDPPGDLEVKITGGAGYAADAIKVFEGINGTLLFSAVILVIVLLILIYRSPVFLFIPLAAVIFAEMLSRSVGYGLSEIGVTINGQSSSIMSILVLGAGTDYALLIVARFREELHHTDDRHVAMQAAMRSAGPAVFASAATVIAALFCLTLAKVNGTSGLGPIGAMGVACAGLSMLTLLPALLTIFGRRAFWPFVPHTPTTEPTDEVPRSGLARTIVEGPTPAALGIVVVTGLWVAITIPAVLLIRAVLGTVELAGGPLSGRCTITCSFPTSCAGAATRSPPTPPTASGSAWGTACLSGPSAWPRVGGAAAGHDRGPGLLLHQPDHQRLVHHRRGVGGGPGAAVGELHRRRQRAHRHRGSAWGRRGRRDQGGGGREGRGCRQPARGPGR